MRAALLLTVAALSGCGSSHPGEGDGTQIPLVASATPMSVHPVTFAADDAKMGAAAAVVEVDGRTVVFGDQGAIVLSCNNVVASDASVVAWRSAAVVDAADGDGSWVLGLDSTGRVQNLASLTLLEDASDRYGLASDDVQGIAGLRGGYIAFLLAKGVALGDGKNVTRYDDTALTSFSGDYGKAAGVASDGVHVFDATKPSRSVYALPGANGVAVLSDGSIAASTATTVYSQAADGSLAPRFHAVVGFRGLVASDMEAWVIDGTELVRIDATGVSRTSGAAIDATAVLRGSPSGDVWVLVGGKLSRFATGNLSSADEQAWKTDMLPIFSRTCSQCHQPGGTSGINLCGYETWANRRPKILDRVGVQKNMPPTGTDFTEDDRAAVVSWASAKP